MPTAPLVGVRPRSPWVGGPSGAAAGLSGSAALASESTLSAAGTAAASGSSVLASASTLTASGVATAAGAAALASVATLAAAGSGAASGSAALAATATLAAVGTATASGTASLASLATLAASGGPGGTAALAAASTLSAAGSASASGAAALASVATLAAAGSATGTGFAAAINFRATSTFVTDGAGQTYSLGEAYPTSRSGFTFGWGAGDSANTRNRTTANDPRLCGMLFASTTGSVVRTFRLDLPAPGQYDIRLAMGDFSGIFAQHNVAILDGSTPLLTISTGQSNTNSFYDAGYQPGDTNWSAAAWPGSNRSVRLTFAGTVLNCSIGKTGTAGQDTELAHLSVVQVAAAGLVGSASLAALATLSASGTATASGQATLAASATLTASGTATTSGSAALASTSALTAAGTATASGTASLISSASLIAGDQAVVGSALLVASASLDAAGTASVEGSALLAAESALWAVGTATGPVAADGGTRWWWPGLFRDLVLVERVTTTLDAGGTPHYARSTLVASAACSIQEMTPQEVEKWQVREADIPVKVCFPAPPVDGAGLAHDDRLTPVDSRGAPVGGELLVVNARWAGGSRLLYIAVATAVESGTIT